MLEGVWYDWQRLLTKLLLQMSADPSFLIRFAVTLRTCRRVNSSHRLRRQYTLDSMPIHVITATAEKLSPRMSDTDLRRPEQLRDQDLSLTARREAGLNFRQAPARLQG